MNIYCCCLQIYVNKLLEIENEPKSMLPTGIIVNMYADLNFAL